jgi:NAD-dependent SIR2 family protein deacetylase
MCKEQKLRSTVTGGGGYSTSMGFQTYNDEDGNYHSHNPNTRSASYSCSNGHMFTISGQDKCPSCDYGAGTRKINAFDKTTKVGKGYSINGDPL